MPASLMHTYERRGDGVRLRVRGDAQATTSFLCFPCAGGTSSGFLPLMDHAPEAWRLAAVDPPGHGLHPARPLDRVEEMVELYARTLDSELARRPFLLGHSLGGLVSYLLALGLEAEGRPPAGVILCATRPPAHVTYDRWSDLSDDALIERIDGIGGIPPSLRDDPETIREHLSATRADFKAIERWYIGRALPAIRAPLLVVAGKNDRFTPQESVSEWASQSAASELAVMEGGHFLPQERPADFAALLKQRLAR